MYFLMSRRLVIFYMTANLFFSIYIFSYYQAVSTSDGAIFSLMFYSPLKLLPLSLCFSALQIPYYHIGNPANV